MVTKDEIRAIYEREWGFCPPAVNEALHELREDKIGIQMIDLEGVLSGGEDHRYPNTREVILYINESIRAHIRDLNRLWEIGLKILEEE